jgi:hypothetical protein
MSSIVWVRNREDEQCNRTADVIERLRGVCT